MKVPAFGGSVIISIDASDAMNLAISRVVSRMVYSNSAAMLMRLLFSSNHPRNVQQSLTGFAEMR